MVNIFLKYKFYLFFVIFFHILFLFFSRFTVWPEMILYPWLLNNGYKLYQDIINPYFPLMNLLLSGFFGIFGSSVLSLKIFTYIIVIIADLSVFFSAIILSKRVSKAFISLLIFIFLHYSFGGNGLWFELFLAPILLLSLVFLYFKISTKSVLVSGVLLAVAILTKQNAMIFFIPAFYLILAQKKFKLIPLLLLPLVLFSFLLLGYLSYYQITQDFLIWSIKLPLSFTNQPGFIIYPTFKQFLIISILFLPVLFLLKIKKVKDSQLFWTAVLIMSSFFIFPRYEDFHLQVLVIFSATLSVLIPKRVQIIFLLIALILFARSAHRLINQPDRFLNVQMYKLADSIRNYPSVYLLNLPELSYFFANKLPPKPWATSFPWYFENSFVAQDFIKNRGDDPYKYVLIGHRSGGGTFDLGNYLPFEILNYVMKNYEQVGQTEEYTVWRLKK